MKSIKVAACNFSNKAKQQQNPSTTFESLKKETSFSSILEKKECMKSFETRNANSKVELLSQMEEKVHLNERVTGMNQETGVVVITVHKARDLQKKGLVGKADPYIVITCNGKKEKSQTVKNSHKPVWHFTTSFDIDASYDKDIQIEVFDKDIGKDDFLGRGFIDMKELRTMKEFINKTFSLKDCKSGELFVSAKFIPVGKLHNEIGKMQLTVHKAKKIEKKKLLKKADPYVLIKLGDENHKTKTVKSISNPVWEFSTEFLITESSPRQISLQIFYDDIGKDADLGNLTIDIKDLMRKQSEENVSYNLENCKSGQLFLSFKYDEFADIHEKQDEIKEISIKTRETEINTIKEESYEEITETYDSHKDSNEFSDDSHGDSKEAVIEYLDPVYFDDEYVILEKRLNSWLMVCLKISIINK